MTNIFSQIDISLFFAIVFIPILVGTLLFSRFSLLRRDAKERILKGTRIKDIEFLAEEIAKDGKEKRTITYSIKNKGVVNLADKQRQDAQDLNAYYSRETVGKAALMKQKIYGLCIGLGVGMVFLIVVQSSYRMLGLIIPFIGYVIPLIISNKKYEKMKKDAIEAIPEVLGYLSAFIAEETGLFLALKIIVDSNITENGGILFANIRESLNVAAAGRNLEDTLMESALKLGIEEWSSCVFTIYEGSKRGTNLEQIVKELEDNYREERRMSIQSRSAKVDAQLSVVGSSMFTPAIMIIIAVPAYMKAFAAMGNAFS